MMGSISASFYFAAKTAYTVYNKNKQKPKHEADFVSIGYFLYKNHVRTMKRVLFHSFYCPFVMLSEE